MDGVVTAGAGPVRLFVACELRISGVRVLERAENPLSSLKHLPFGRRALTAPTIKAFYRRGMLDAIAIAMTERA